MANEITEDGEKAITELCDRCQSDLKAVRKFYAEKLASLTTARGWDRERVAYVVAEYMELELSQAFEAAAKDGG